MKLGLLGPCQDREDALLAGARFLVEEQRVDRGVYLGIDGALDPVVRRWASELVGGDPSDRAVWRRATDRCLAASAAEIDAFLDAERRRRALSVLEALPERATRLVELLDGRVVVMIHDKADLDEEDILPASLLVFGKGRHPLVRQVGTRWFLSPGSLEEFGVMTLEDAEDGIHLAVFDRNGHEVRKERIVAGRAARLKVAGGG